MRHADFKALFESAVLTLVPGDAHDDTARRVLTRFVLDVLFDRTTKESLKSEINFHRFYLLVVTKYMIVSGRCIETFVQKLIPKLVLLTLSVHYEKCECVVEFLLSPTRFQ